MMDDVRSLYTNLVATQLRSDGLTKLFGDDICELVLSYLPSIHVVADSNLSIMRLQFEEDISAQIEENWIPHIDDGEHQEVMLEMEVDEDVEDESAHRSARKTGHNHTDPEDDNEDPQRLQISVTPAKMHRVRADSDVDGNVSTEEAEHRVNPLLVSCNVSDGSNEDGHQTDHSNMSSLTPR